MIAIYVHPPKTLPSGEDYLLDAPDVVRWWGRAKIVGDACLVPVEQLRQLLPKRGSLKELERQEGCHVVMVVRRD